MACQACNKNNVLFCSAYEVRFLKVLCCDLFFILNMKFSKSFCICNCVSFFSKNSLPQTIKPAISTQSGCTCIHRRGRFAQKCCSRLLLVSHYIHLLSYSHSTHSAECARRKAYNHSDWRHLKLKVITLDELLMLPCNHISLVRSLFR